ncbi:hypothetical protein [Brevundimonas subvibrioides]|uniref:Uncharacterized protein n=1 Tax=Brevundimonas subvibrioides (strain ATCC 15264 / DSM 4735 / LMG 14903 / NBRC 16000 / CB 81) TaxID=633149 RepID=D9QIA7_BRESC|nr:hypothetical protein [Brevundimonas subvibrioides]ADK99409.1 hypothetical protein Bresu_0095 [Brevundimonas subvibrioides ATCC 15264]
MDALRSANHLATSETVARPFHYPPPWDGVVWAPRPPLPRWADAVSQAVTFWITVAAGALVAGVLLNAVLGAAVAVLSGAA